MGAHGKTSRSPYDLQPERAFWKRSLGAFAIGDVLDIHVPRFPLARRTRVSTAGSCFAQHVSREVRKYALRFIDKEPRPPMLSDEDALALGFDMYSARFGNIYSVRQLLQLILRACGEFVPSEDVWRRGDRFVDPFRPGVSGEGFVTEDELRQDRAYHLAMVCEMFRDSDVLVFTMGMTEVWVSKEDGAAFPLCPGTAGGTFDARRHELVEMTASEIVDDMTRCLDLLRTFNPDIRLLVTVSPVPLIATATAQHILVANTASKSTLRAACEELRRRHDCVDYFPSYELIATHPSRGAFFGSDLRSVSPLGVGYVMQHFARSYGLTAEMAKAAPSPVPVPDNLDVACDEELLEQFAT